MSSPHAHLFALCYPNISSIHATLIPGHSYTIDDKTLVGRVSKILRLRSGDRLILFDDKINIKVILDAISKNSIKVILEVVEENKISSFTLAVGLLKKGSFEKVAYAAAACGVRKLVPIITERSRREFYGRDRISSVMVAAREQSKSFASPELCEPVRLEDINHLSTDDGLKFYCDFDGVSLCTIASKPTPSHVLVVVGPEGGFTEKESKFLNNSGITPLSLTDTTLRAVDAARIVTGALMSFWKN